MTWRSVLVADRTVRYLHTSSGRSASGSQRIAQGAAPVEPLARKQTARKQMGRDQMGRDLIDKDLARGDWPGNASAARPIDKTNPDQARLG